LGKRYVTITTFRWSVRAVRRRFQLLGILWNGEKIFFWRPQSGAAATHRS